MYSIVDAELEARLAEPQERSRWLLLDRHPDFPGHWIVEGFSNEYLYDLGECLGSYRAVAPAGLQPFLEVAARHGYEVAFFVDPTPDLYLHVERLTWTPEVMIDSTFPNTVNGMLPYQVQGYNFLKDRDFGVARWDTGTGKSVLAAALVSYHQWRDDFDIGFVVVKKHNKVNTVRKLASLAGVEAINLTGTKAQRERIWGRMSEAVQSGQTGSVLVLNYEQFKDLVTRDADKKLLLTDVGQHLFTDNDLMFLWDEMPVKLKTRTSGLYKAICKLLYKTAPPQVSWAQRRPRSMWSYMLSATPIENSPEDWFNCVRLMDGGRTYGTVTDFEDMYVKSWNHFDPSKPDEFHDFERMRLKAMPFIHQVSKDAPEIAAVFPRAVEEVVYIDWDDKTAALYNTAQDLAENVADGAEVGEVPIFSLIGTLQMLCDAPAMVLDSAARREVYEAAQEAWEGSQEGQAPTADGSEFALALADRLQDKLTNAGHPKFERLRELLVEQHPDSQAVLFTKLNYTLMPYLEAKLSEWGITYGRYSGTERQQQAVQDSFQAGEIRVFLTSDMGSDSIDLDSGNVVIDYNLPWKWTTLVQRHNRIHRPTSAHDTVYYYTLVMEGSVEERVLQIIEKKRGYHNALFGTGEPTTASRLTREELWYILVGR